MKEFEQRRLFRKIFFSRSVFVLFLCALVFVSFSVFDIYKKSREALLKNEATENELQDLQKRGDIMGANINRLKTDVGIEAELKKKFQIKKPGEKFIIFVDKEEEISEEESKKQEEGFFQKIWDLIKF
ncbi:septum formation initiator family protein [Patescibacteria group bacterium]|nr:septum formation initiator family protein [Patescibacteria group bacterium]MBU2633211.1 septum formation initiator family protein [Patescibacteria group bacterium]